MGKKQKEIKKAPPSGAFFLSLTGVISEIYLIELYDVLKPVVSSVNKYVEMVYFDVFKYIVKVSLLRKRFIIALLLELSTLIRVLPLYSVPVRECFVPFWSRIVIL